MRENMTLEEYKESIKTELLQRTNIEITNLKMEIHKEDLKKFYQEDWEVMEVATGMAMNML